MAVNDIDSYAAVVTPALTDDLLTQQTGLTKKTDEIFECIPNFETLDTDDLALTDVFIVEQGGSEKKATFQQLLTYVQSIAGGYIYCGDDGSRLQDTDKYLPDTWTNKTNAPSPARERLAASTISNKGYIYCGDDSGGYIQDTDEYDPDSWTSKTNAPNPTRHRLAASTILNKGYIYCGYDGSNELQDTDEYDPDSWTSKTDCPSPARINLAASTIGD